MNKGETWTLVYTHTIITLVIYIHFFNQKAVTSVLDKVQDFTFNSCTNVPKGDNKLHIKTINASLSSTST